jgi:hypothetical protein
LKIERDVMMMMMTMLMVVGQLMFCNLLLDFHPKDMDDDDDDDDYEQNVWVMLVQRLNDQMNV